LSIVIIVNFSVTATCAFYCFHLQPEYFPGHDLPNSGHKIADIELLTERHWP